MAMEIERKFLLQETVERLAEQGIIHIVSEQRIEQTYLALDVDQELRVRKITNVATGELTFTHTFKQGNGLAREEIEYSINESIYEQVVNAFQAVPLTKNRVTAEWNDTVIEIDIYDQLKLTVLEIEFESESEAHAFDAPDWFGKDISDERQYSNKTVWRELQKK
ncbi:CYTH domain-containing protein [Paenibacillus harenae]|uniref:CYTH domain-containing protein n=1 Tax=Paenibacillus harenae TaxID=306543 RepID=UPI002792A4E9|nr:CYTH domain-containing protein [Paenibacillus harenae]MDQ0063422.1 CYTH domain-containing protein [Paenibacillus harenae]